MLFLSHTATSLSRDEHWQMKLLGLGYQQLRIGKDGYVPSISNVLSDAGRFLLRSGDAAKIVADVLAATRNWMAVFAGVGVSQADVDLCANFVLRPALLV